MCTQGQLNWTVVTGELRNHSLQLPATAEYQFAVAASRGAHSSGMVWSRCVVLANGGERRCTCLNFGHDWVILRWIV